MCDKKNGLIYLDYESFDDILLSISVKYIQIKLFINVCQQKVKKSLNGLCNTFRLC